ncbi:MAG: hypothetical protein AAGG38_02875 [Planctomycetota bacterium]
MDVTPPTPPAAPRTAADILADLRSLDRENDRLELHAAMIRQNLKAAEARLDAPAAMDAYLDRAAHQLRRVG